MKTKITLRFVCTFVLTMLFPAIYAQVTYNYTGSLQTYTVPIGTNSLTIECLGAQGGSNGGLGAQIIGDVAVSAGDVLTIVVGEEGLLQVGGNVQNSAGGGGGTFVYNASSNTLLMAAGGGGGRCPWTSAVPLHADCDGQAGTSGGQNSDGTSFGGTGGNGGDPGIWGVDICAGGGTGWLTVGGGGAHGGLNATTWAGGVGYCNGGGGGCGGVGGYGGGGGGGNLYGGGGGGGGYSGGAGGNDPDHGGGGGSFNSGLNQINNTGVNSGNGQVIITGGCTDSALVVTVSSYAICGSDQATLTATSVNGGTISWDNGVTNGVPFTPLLTGENTYIATSTNPLDCPYEVILNYSDYPQLDPGPDAEVCEGVGAVLNATSTTGPDVTFNWSPFILNNVGFTPNFTGVQTYIVTADSYGCQTVDSATVTVHPAPEIGAGPDVIECSPSLVILTGTGNADTYTWDNGVVNGVGFTPPFGTNTYTLTGQFSTTLCESDDQVTVTYYSGPTVIGASTDEIFGGDGTAEITITGGTQPIVIDWDDDGTGDNDDDAMIDSLVGGTYTATVIDDNGCTVSIDVVVNSQLSIGENDLNISVYPNPATTQFEIIADGQFNYALYNMLGEIIISGVALDKSIVDISAFEKGVYLLDVMINDQKVVNRIVKQ